MSRVDEQGRSRSAGQGPDSRSCATISSGRGKAAAKVRVSYAGECTLEEAVSRFVAMRENVRDACGDEPS